MSSRRQPERIRPTVRSSDGWIGVAFRYNRALVRTLRCIRPHEYTPAVWLCDLRLEPATWWFPPRQLGRLQWMLSPHHIVLELPPVPRDPVVSSEGFVVGFRYRGRLP